MKVLFLTRYGQQGASSRVRCAQYLPMLRAHGIEIMQQSLLSDTYLQSLYQGRRVWTEVIKCYGRRLAHLWRKPPVDLIWIEKELFPYLPYWCEAWLLRGTPYVVDMDDAVFHNYDLSRRTLVRWTLNHKIDHLLHSARMAITGNRYLGDRARSAGAPRVEILPSVIDLDRYIANIEPVCAASTSTPGRPCRIVWIGSPATAHYLSKVQPPLTRLASRRALELWVIGAPAPDWPGVSAISLAWQAETETQLLAQCDVGIMPLDDTPWEQGKCSFKLIQYMACGLPVVASAVGMNLDVVTPGDVGFLAKTDDEWEAALERLASHPQDRADMGARGRAQVVRQYSLQATAPRLARLLKEASI